MLDMGWAEIGVLFVLALLIFGPDKLPKFAADAAGMIRKLRELAQNAQTGLTDQGIDVDGIKNDLQSVAELHPKRIASSVMGDLTAATSAATALPAKDAPPTPADASSNTASVVTASAAAESDANSVAREATTEPEAVPTVKVVPASATKIDPDAT